MYMCFTLDICYILTLILIMLFDVSPVFPSCDFWRGYGVFFTPLYSRCVGSHYYLTFSSPINCAAPVCWLSTRFDMAPFPGRDPGDHHSEPAAQ